jgi:two-component system response regulator YesN
MTQKIRFSKLISDKSFSQIQRAFRKHFRLGLETTTTHGKMIGEMCSEDCMPSFCKMVREVSQGRKRCDKERQRSLKIAFDTGQSYITICHAGIVLVCVPMMDKDNPVGAMFFGKCLWEQISPALIDDIKKRLKNLDIKNEKMVDTLKELPVITGRKIHDAAKFLFDLLYEVSDLDPRVIRWRQERTHQQSQIGEFMQEQKKLGTDWRYPLESERELIGKVKIGDRTGAKEILNSILGTILFHNPGQLDHLKARMLELLSILSRAAVEGGVDINLLLGKNLDYINKVMKIDNQEDLCVWISIALNEFFDLVYSAQDARKITQIRPAINYIDANYDKQVSLANIARAAHLSVSRLAHVFKEQMNITIIDYLTSVRIERAKQLLLATAQSCTEIFAQVGYNNQSYFTRTFKDLAGMTPRQFRDRNRRDGKLFEPTDDK